MRQTTERVDERREACRVAGFEFRPRQKVIHSGLELAILRCGRAGGIADGRRVLGAKVRREIAFHADMPGKIPCKRSFKTPGACIATAGKEIAEADYLVFT